MVRTNLDKLCWGFFFIMVSFRINGFDIFPDIVGYILFASAFHNLASCSYSFDKAFKYNIPMIFLSIFALLQRTDQEGVLQISPPGVLGIIIAMAAFILNLIVVYHLFSGIKDIKEVRELPEFTAGADRKWHNYLALQMANLFIFFLFLLPTIAFIYIFGLLVASVVVLIGIIRYIKACKEIVTTD